MEKYWETCYCRCLSHTEDLKLICLVRGIMFKAWATCSKHTSLNVSNWTFAYVLQAKTQIDRSVHSCSPVMVCSIHITSYPDSWSGYLLRHAAWTFCRAWSRSKLLDTDGIRDFSFFFFFFFFWKKKKKTKKKKNIHRRQKSMQKLPSMQRVKGGRKKNPSWVSPCSKGKSYLGVGISTRDSASLAPGWNSYPSDEISLSCMDTHDVFLSSRLETHIQGTTWESVPAD